MIISFSNQVIFFVEVLFGLLKNLLGHFSYKKFPVICRGILSFLNYYLLKVSIAVLKSVFDSSNVCGSLADWFVVPFFPLYALVLCYSLFLKNIGMIFEAWEEDTFLQYLYICFCQVFSDTTTLPLKTSPWLKITRTMKVYWT